MLPGEEQGIKLKGMLPTPAAFTELMQASGVNKDGAVVIAGRKDAADCACGRQLGTGKAVLQ